jgi:hypothetical protein
MDAVDRKWYDPFTFHDLMILRDAINQLRNENEKKFCMLALASLTRNVSKIDSRCINHIVVDNHKTRKNVFDLFLKKIIEMEKSVDDYLKVHTTSSIKVAFGDARNLREVKSGSIDLIISHPPYLGCINYSNIFKLANKILGHEYDIVKKNDISTNSVKQYYSDMDVVFDEMYRIVKSQRYVCVIIGDNRVNGDIIPTFSHFIDYAQKIGFKLKDTFIWVLNQKAGMSIKRRGNHIDHNYILIFQKP